MPTTCKLIAKNVLSSNAADVTFSSIPGTYTDLFLVFTVRTSRAVTVDTMKMQFNATGSDTDHSSRLLFGDGSTAGSSTSTFARAGYAVGANATSNTFASNEIYIPNYAGSANKSFSLTSASEDNNAAASIMAAAGLWASSAAITSIKIFPNTAVNIVSGSSFFLYGITKA